MHFTFSFHPFVRQSHFTVNSISLNVMAAHRTRDIHIHISHQIVLYLIKLQIRAFDMQVHINTYVHTTQTHILCTHECAVIYLIANISTMAVWFVCAEIVFICIEYVYSQQRMGNLQRKLLQC